MVTAASNLLECLSRKGGSLGILILWLSRAPERENVCGRPLGDGWCKVPRGSSSGHRSRCQDDQGIFLTRDSSLKDCAC